VDGASDGERGQGTLEWIGLVLLVSLLLLALLTVAGSRLPAGLLARALVDRILCAVSLSDSCSTVPALVGAYGPELAAAVERNAPDLIYEPGSAEIPVDFRSCKGPTGCGHGATSGAVDASSTGEPATAFVHAVDCRPAAIAETERHGFDCSGERSGNLYLQYWLYYEDSATPPWGKAGYHEDDWGSGTPAWPQIRRQHAEAGPVNPEILFDNCGDFEDLAWVPVAMARTRAAAKCVIDVALEGAYDDMLRDEHMYMRVDGRRAWMTPDPELAGSYPEEQLWKHCQPSEPDAEEFWVCEMVERRISLRRGWEELRDVRKAPGLYRSHRENGQSRWTALKWAVDVYCKPRWWRRRYRLRRWIRAARGKAA
jgi:hypothetical protein